MIVDDRLDTVLQTQAAGRAGLNTQFRQLVDLLGRTPDHVWTDRHAGALDRVDALHAGLGDAAAAVLVGLCTLRKARLIGHLARLGPRTAIAAITRARLDDAAWLQLIPALPIHARGALRHRRDLTAPVIALLERLGIDDFVLSGPKLDSTAPLPEAPATTEAPAQAEAPPPAVLVQLSTGAQRRADATTRDGTGREGIGAIVQRIEAFRRNRQNEAPIDPGQTRLPFAEDPAAEPVATTVDITIDAAGMITGATGVDPALVVGHRPFVHHGPGAAASTDAQTLQAFAAHQPIVAGRLVLDGAPRIAGVWRIDGAPRFGGDGGQFHGYHARLRRPVAAGHRHATDHDPADHGAADSLQQLLHELRTPINAIQGFAELIQQQLLGSTPHQYRSLAASIAADAARMLAGFEDVERLVRLETGRVRIEPGQSDLAAIMTRLASQLEPLVAPREVRLRWSVPDEPVPIAIDPVEAERLVWRLLSTLTGASAPGERLTLLLEHCRQAQEQREHDDLARLAMTLPATLARRDDDALFAPDIGRSGNGAMGMLGHGFALRLAAAEVRTAGGRLTRPGAPGSALLELTLPLVPLVRLDRNPADF
jgi:signal transduction histidine kinase